MIGTLVTLIVVCAIAGLAYWAVNTLGAPEPIRRIVIVAIVVIAALIVIGLIAGLFGVNLGLPRT